jgi:hypothetical protein
MARWYLQLILALFSLLTVQASVLPLGCTAATARSGAISLTDATHAGITCAAHLTDLFSRAASRTSGSVAQNPSIASCLDKACLCRAFTICATASGRLSYGIAAPRRALWLLNRALLH